MAAQAGQAMSPQRKIERPRRRVASQLLPREDRMREAAKIVNKNRRDKRAGGSWSVLKTCWVGWNG